jgi:hypothetical protein
METNIKMIFLAILVLSLTVVFAVDTIHKRRRFLAGQDR